MNENSNVLRGQGGQTRRSARQTLTAAALSAAAFAGSLTPATPAQAHAGSLDKNMTVHVWRCPAGWSPTVLGVHTTSGPVINAVTSAKSPTVTAHYVTARGRAAHVVVSYVCRGRYWWNYSTPVPVHGDRWISSSTSVLNF